MSPLLVVAAPSSTRRESRRTCRRRRRCPRCSGTRSRARRAPRAASGVAVAPSRRPLPTWPRSRRRSSRCGRRRRRASRRGSWPRARQRRRARGRACGGRGRRSRRTRRRRAIATRHPERSPSRRSSRAMIRTLEPGTIAVYEARADEWRDRRPARFLGPGAAVVRGDGATTGACACRPRVRRRVRTSRSLGSPGRSRSTPRGDARSSRPSRRRDAARVQADLEALPFRRGALGGAWARASPTSTCPRALPSRCAELHRAPPSTAPCVCRARRRRWRAPGTTTSSPGRFFAHWQPRRLATCRRGAGFDVDECALAEPRRDGRSWIDRRRRDRARLRPGTLARHRRLRDARCSCAA